MRLQIPFTFIPQTLHNISIILCSVHALALSAVLEIDRFNFVSITCIVLVLTFGNWRCSFSSSLLNNVDVVRTHTVTTHSSDPMLLGLDRRLLDSLASSVNSALIWYLLSRSRNVHSIIPRPLLIFHTSFKSFVMSEEHLTDAHSLSDPDMGSLLSRSGPASNVLKRRAFESLEDDTSRKRLKEHGNNNLMNSGSDQNLLVAQHTLADDLAQELNCGCCSELCYHPVVVSPCQHFFCGR